MDNEPKEKIESFKSDRINRPPFEIIAHYKKELQAIQDTWELIAIKS